MPSREPSGYWSAVLAGANRPFLYRSRVRNLLGFPDKPGALRPQSSANLPPLGFTYFRQPWIPRPYGAEPDLGERLEMPALSALTSRTEQGFAEPGQVSGEPWERRRPRRPMGEPDRLSNPEKPERRESVRSEPAGTPALPGSLPAIIQTGQRAGSPSEFRQTPATTVPVQGLEGESTDVLSRPREASPEHQPAAPNQVDSPARSGPPKPENMPEPETESPPADVEGDQTVHATTLAIPGMTTVKSRPVQSVPLENTLQAERAEQTRRQPTTRGHSAMPGTSIPPPPAADSIGGYTSPQEDSIQAGEWSGESAAHIQPRLPDAARLTLRGKAGSYPMSVRGFSPGPAASRPAAREFHEPAGMENGAALIEQLRRSVQELAAKAAAPREAGVDATSGQTHHAVESTPLPLPPRVIVRTVPAVSAAPAAFWERSYLSRFWLRSLR